MVFNFFFLSIAITNIAIVCKLYGTNIATTQLIVYATFLKGRLMQCMNLTTNK